MFGRVRGKVIRAMRQIELNDKGSGYNRSCFERFIKSSSHPHIEKYQGEEDQVSTCCRGGGGGGGCGRSIAHQRVKLPLKTDLFSPINMQLL